MDSLVKFMAAVSAVRAAVMQKWLLLAVLTNLMSSHARRKVDTGAAFKYILFHSLFYYVLSMIEMVRAVVYGLCLRY